MRNRKSDSVARSIHRTPAGIVPPSRLLARNCGGVKSTSRPPNPYYSTILHPSEAGSKSSWGRREKAEQENQGGWEDGAARGGGMSDVRGRQ